MTRGMFSLRLGKSQGILQTGHGNFKYQENQGKVREFSNFRPEFVLWQLYLSILSDIFAGLALLQINVHFRKCMPSHKP